MKAKLGILSTINPKCIYGETGAIISTKNLTGRQKGGKNEKSKRKSHTITIHFRRYRTKLHHA